MLWKLIYHLVCIKTIRDLNIVFIFRESAAGVNRVSYFLAVNFAQMPIMVVMPLVYLSLQYTLTSPRCKFAKFINNFNY